MRCEALSKYVVLFAHVLGIVQLKKRMRPRSWGALLGFAPEIEVELRVHPQVTRPGTGERSAAL